MAHIVSPDDGTARWVLYTAYRARIDRSFRKFTHACTDWDFALLKDDNRTMGAAVRRGGELHIGILPEWRGRWATKGFIRAILNWAAETGPVVTGVLAGNSSGTRLVEGVGFVKQEDTKLGVRYAIPS